MQDERRFNVRTLVIASIASAAAAVITSQFWIRGTPIAAALTPVIVTLVSELLHRPTEKIAQRRPARDPDIRVYKAGRKRRIAWATVLGTGLLAFVIAAAVITIPEAISGNSLFHGDRSTTLGGSKKNKADDSQPTETTTETVTETTPAPETTPDEGSTQRTTPTTPTTTAPQQRGTPPASTAPAPQTTAPTTPSQ